MVKSHTNCYSKLSYKITKSWALNVKGPMWLLDTKQYLNILRKIKESWDVLLCKKKQLDFHSDHLGLYALKMTYNKTYIYQSNFFYRNGWTFIIAGFQVLIIVQVCYTHTFIYMDCWLKMRRLWLTHIWNLHYKALLLMSLLSWKSELVMLTKLKLKQLVLP